MERIEIHENELYMVLEITDEKEVKFLHFAAVPFNEADIVSERIRKEAFHLFEINISGLDKPYERHGNKYIVSAPGYRMKYSHHKMKMNDLGRKLEMTTFDEETGIYVTTHIQFYRGISIARFWNVVENKGHELQVLEYISSFNYTGIEKEGMKPRDEKMFLKIPHHSWQREMNWRSYTFPELGVGQVQKTVEERSSNAIEVTNVGNWSSKCYLPMGYLENREMHTSLYWQIEHNGSWHWEIGDQNGHFYLNLTGPDELHAHWYKNLNPNDTFTTVPVAVGASKCTVSVPEAQQANHTNQYSDVKEQEYVERNNCFDRAMGELTKYRRIIRRPNTDNETLKVIFNDYMNSLWGDPTTDKEIPLIDAAAEVGCEYYCIDAGWYADGAWWDNVGLWQESRERFPNGLKEVTDYIREKGMVPGVWLELEVMGIHCPKVKEVSEDWFFVRHGKKVYDRSRYQLDFRNLEVITYANEVIDRLVTEYGVGYIKMDYNIEPGIGTELYAESMGEGLLAHERAYLTWLDNIFIKYPELVIENCSSGGLRMDYAMLSRYSIQSTSDQDDYLKYATIAANAPAAITPEQAAVWSYPLREGDKEEVVFNMINAMLLRIHQSGHLAYISKERKALVKEALDYYKGIRSALKNAVPIWPLGLSKYEEEWASLGLKTDKKIYLAVWRREGNQSHCQLPLYAEEVEGVKCVYPSYEACQYKYDRASQILNIKLEKTCMARLFEITLK